MTSAYFTPSAPLRFRESIWSNARRSWRKLRKKRLGILTDGRPWLEFHGEDAYGGWPILADSLHADSNVVSVGIGTNASFDLSLMARHGCRVHGMDPTPRSAEWVRTHISDPRFVFDERALADQDGTLSLYLPLDPAHVSASCIEGDHVGTNRIERPCVTLDTLMREKGVNSLDLLKMDVEGAEYAVIAQSLASGTLQQVSQLLVEFHHFFPNVGPAPTLDAIARLRAAGFALSWISKHEREFVFKNTRHTRSP
jgi:FkbM family methyltransferase